MLKLFCSQTYFNWSIPRIRISMSCILPFFFFFRFFLVLFLLDVELQQRIEIDIGHEWHYTWNKDRNDQDKD